MRLVWRGRLHLERLAPLQIQEAREVLRLRASRTSPAIQINIPIALQTARMTTIGAVGPCALPSRSNIAIAEKTVITSVPPPRRIAFRGEAAMENMIEPMSI